MSIKSTRRSLLVGAASLITAPYVARAGSLTLLGAGSFSTPAPWAPASLTSLVAWWGADNGVTTSGGNVTQVIDQSGHGYTLTSGANAVPFNAASAFNAKPAFDFTAANDAYLGTSLAGAPVTVLPDTAHLSVFVVGRLHEVAFVTFARLVSIGEGAAADYASANNIVAMYDNGTNLATYYNNGATSFGDPVIVDTNYRFGLVCDGVNATHYINNVAATSAAISLSLATPQNIVIGNQWLSSGTVPSSEAWQGPICEIVITSSALSLADRNNLDSYFTTKWGT